MDLKEVNGNKGERNKKQGLESQQQKKNKLITDANQDDITSEIKKTDNSALQRNASTAYGAKRLGSNLTPLDRHLLDPYKYGGPNTVSQSNLSFRKKSPLKSPPQAHHASFRNLSQMSY